MPYGITQPGQVNGPVGPPPAIISHRRQLDDASVTVPQQLGAGSGDLWQHVTLVPGTLPRLVRSDSSVPATKLVILERDAIAVYVTFGREASMAAGAYDLVHPGSGFLSFAIPASVDLGIMLDPAGGAPTNPLEVWLLAGPSAVR